MLRAMLALVTLAAVAGAPAPPRGAEATALSESLEEATVFTGCPANSYYWGYYAVNRQHYCVPCSHKGAGLSSKGCSTNCAGNAALHLPVKQSFNPTRQCASLNIVSCVEDKAAA